MKMELNKIYKGDCLEGLKILADNSIDCCVTSPPYFGLRDYGTAEWEGGNDPDCEHWIAGDGECAGIKQQTNSGSLRKAKDVCPSCGAKRIDKQIGLEETPELFVSKLIEVFTEVRRVLKNEGTLWLNLGDSYNGSGKAAGQSENATNMGVKMKERIYDVQKPTKVEGLKPKDLIGIPWMVAFALRTSGWYLRQDIIWHKPNPMPESVTDRCTKSHEYVFLLSKSSKYYYDNDAIKEPCTSIEMDEIKGLLTKGGRGGFGSLKGKNNRIEYSHSNQTGKAWEPSKTRNKRSVWIVTTKPFSEAHFATFPQDLIVDCIKAGCPEGGIILDPFMGAGTTALVSRKLNRNFIGFELNEDYIRIAEGRLGKELGMFS